MSYWDIEDLKRDLPMVVLPWTVLSTDTQVRIGIVEDRCVKTLVTINRNLDATVTQNQIPVSGQFSFNDEKVWSVLADIHASETCKGETAEELQNFARRLTSTGWRNSHRETLTARGAETVNKNTDDVVIGITHGMGVEISRNTTRDRLDISCSDISVSYRLPKSVIIVFDLIMTMNSMLHLITNLYVLVMITILTNYDIHFSVNMPP